MHPTEDAPKDLASKVSQFLSEWTGNKWHILMTQEKGDLTLEQQKEKEKKETINKIKENDKIKEILNIFPGSKIAEVKNKGEKNE